MFVKLPDRDKESAKELQRIIENAKAEIARAFAVPQLTRRTSKEAD